MAKQILECVVPSKQLCLSACQKTLFKNVMHDVNSFCKVFTVIILYLNEDNCVIIPEICYESLLLNK